MTPLKPKSKSMEGDSRGEVFPTRDSSDDEFMSIDSLDDDTSSDVEMDNVIVKYDMRNEPIPMSTEEYYYHSFNSIFNETEEEKRKEFDVYDLPKLIRLLEDPDILFDRTLKIPGILGKFRILFEEKHKNDDLIELTLDSEATLDFFERSTKELFSQKTDLTRTELKTRRKLKKAIRLARKIPIYMCRRRFGEDKNMRNIETFINQRNRLKKWYKMTKQLNFRTVDDLIKEQNQEERKNYKVVNRSTSWVKEFNKNNFYFVAKLHNDNPTNMDPLSIRYEIRDVTPDMETPDKNTWALKQEWGELILLECLKQYLDNDKIESASNLDLPIEFVEFVRVAHKYQQISSNFNNKVVTKLEYNPNIRFDVVKDIFCPTFEDPIKLLVDCEVLMNRIYQDDKYFKKSINLGLPHQKYYTLENILAIFCCVVLNITHWNPIIGKKICDSNNLYTFICLKIFAPSLKLSIDQCSIWLNDFYKFSKMIVSDMLQNRDQGWIEPFLLQSEKCGKDFAHFVQDIEHRKEEEMKRIQRMNIANLCVDPKNSANEDKKSGFENNQLLFLLWLLKGFCLKGYGEFHSNVYKAIKLKFYWPKDGSDKSQLTTLENLGNVKSLEYVQKILHYQFKKDDANTYVNCYDDAKTIDDLTRLKYLGEDKKEEKNDDCFDVEMEWKIKSDPMTWLNVCVGGLPGIYLKQCYKNFLQSAEISKSKEPSILTTFERAGIIKKINNYNIKWIQGIEPVKVAYRFLYVDEIISQFSTIVSKFGNISGKMDATRHPVKRPSIIIPQISDFENEDPKTVIIKRIDNIYLDIVSNLMTPDKDKLLFLDLLDRLDKLKQQLLTH